MAALVQDLRLDCPRTWVRCEDSMVKLDANMDALSLRQSVQWQTKRFITPGPSVGCLRWLDIKEYKVIVVVYIKTYKRQLNGAAEAGCCCFPINVAAVAGQAVVADVGLRFVRCGVPLDHDDGW